MNFSAVSSGWFKYPLANPDPEIYNLPVTPIGKGCNASSNM